MEIDLHKNHEASVGSQRLVAPSVAVDAEISSKEAHAAARAIVERDEPKTLTDAP